MQPLINMDTSDDKNILMRKLAIYEFGFRSILNLMFELESLSIYRPYQTRSQQGHQFESVPAAATYSLVLLAILFFIELFRIRILLFFINLRMR